MKLGSTFEQYKAMAWSKDAPLRSQIYKKFAHWLSENVHNEAFRRVCSEKRLTSTFRSSIRVQSFPHMLAMMSDRGHT